jgi:hypothetical protein
MSIVQRGLTWRLIISVMAGASLMALMVIMEVGAIKEGKGFVTTSIAVWWVVVFALRWRLEQEPVALQRRDISIDNNLCNGLGGFCGNQWTLEK